MRHERWPVQFPKWALRGERDEHTAVLRAALVGRGGLDRSGVACRTTDTYKQVAGNVGPAIFGGGREGELRGSVVWAWVVPTVQSACWLQAAVRIWALNVSLIMATASTRRQ